VIRLGNHFTSSRLSVCALNVATKSSQSILFSIREIVYHVLIYITTRLNRFQFFIDVFRSCFHTSYVNHVVPKPSTVAKRLARHFTLGRSRVLTPVPPDQVWFFFRGFPHHHILVCLISQIRRLLGQHQLLQYLPSSFRTSACPPSGGMKDVSFSSFAKPLILSTESLPVN
jgi:hypothetical protein